jgi:Mat/Ecp fimbriae outer membrane usher protein
MRFSLRKPAGFLTLILGGFAFAAAMMDSTQPYRPKQISASVEIGDSGEYTEVLAENASAESQRVMPQPLSQEAGEARPNGGFRYSSNGVPEGFEAWFETQKIALDMYYGGRYLVTTLAELSDNRITLLSPEEVSPLIPGVRNPVIMAELLRSPLDSNSTRACRQPNEALCGRLEPDTVGIIFDETRLRADLFVHRDLLSSVLEADPRYLPDSTSENITLVQNLNSLYTGDDAGNEAFSLFGRTRAGNNGNYVFSDWVSTNRQDLSVDQIGYRHDLRDHLVTAGIFETNLDMLRGMSRDLLLGAGVEKSMMRRTDLDSIIATPVDLFLPVRGRVDIFRDGRLISTGFYEAGNQRIDTSRLPAGAYLIEIVTTDAAGNSSIQEQLFVKSTLLAPPGEAIWFVEAGKVMQRAPLDTLPNEIDVALMRAGYRWRQASWLGLGVAGAATDHAALGELSANMMFDWLEAGGEVYSSSAGGWGMGARIIMRRGDNALSLNARHSEADRMPALSEPQYRLIDSDRWLYSAQFNRRIGSQASLNISTAVSGGAETDSVRSSNIRYSRYYFLGGNSAVTLTGDIGETDGDTRVALGLQWRAFHDHWNHRAQLDWSSSNIAADQDGLSAQIASRWQDKDSFVDDIDAGIAAQFDDSGHGATADIRHESEFGRGQAAVSVDQRDLFDRTQYLAGYDTSIVIGESAKPAIGGGPISNEASAILDLRNGDGSVVEVYADNQRQFAARGGRRVPVTLTPYREYQISLIDRGTTLVNFDAEPKRIVLYPGDVSTLRWNLQRVNIIVGRIHRVQQFCSEVTQECYSLRLPLADSRIGGLEGFVFTDADGFFQGDIAEDVTELRARHGGSECVIDISHLDIVEGVIRASGLICTTDGAE